MGKESFSRPESVSHVSRRDLLRWSGAGGVTFLAGCGGDGDTTPTSGDGGGQTTTTGDGGTTTTTEDGVEIADSRLDVTIGNSPADPSALHQNLLNPTGDDRSDLLTARYVAYDELYDEYGTWRPLLLKENKLEGSTVTWTFREGIPFSNGEEITAETWDIEATLRQAQNHPLFQLVSSTELVDKYTYKFELEKPVTSVFWNNPVHRNLAGAFTPKSIYGKFKERLEDATTDQARNSVVEDFTTFRVNPDSDGRFPNTSGPLAVKELTTQYEDYEVRDDHPDAELFNFDTVRLWYQDTSKQVREFTNGNIDLLNKSCCGFWTSQERSTWPEDITPYSWKRAKYNVIAFNLQHKWFGNRKIRQAIAYMLDRKEMGIATWGPETGKNAFPKTLHGLNSITWENWKDELSDIDYIDYGVRGKPDQAASLLEEVGWSKEGGQWVDENGKKVTWSFIIQGGSAQQAFGDVAVSQFNEFGIETRGTRVDNVGSSTGDMTGGPNHMTTNAGGGRGSAAVIATMDDSWSGREGIDPNISNTVMIPMPIGDPDGDLKEVDPEDWTTQLASTDRQKRVEATRMLTWMHNVYIPMLPTVSGFTAFYLWTNNWDIPVKEEFPNGKFAEGAAIEGKPWDDGLYTGNFQAKEQ